jgi:hypothetical protein
MAIAEALHSKSANVGKALGKISPLSSPIIKTNLQPGKNPPGIPVHRALQTVARGAGYWLTNNPQKDVGVLAAEGVMSVRIGKEDRISGSPWVAFTNLPTRQGRKHFIPQAAGWIFPPVVTPTAAATAAAVAVPASGIASGVIATGIPASGTASGVVSDTSSAAADDLPLFLPGADFLDVSDDDDIEESDSEEGYEESASASVPVASVPIAASVSVSVSGPAFASFAAPVLASASEIPAKVTSSDAAPSAVSVATTSDGSLFGLEDFLDVSDDDDIEESDSEEGYEESASASVPVSSVPIAASVSASVSVSGPGPASASFAAPVVASASEIPAKVTASDAVDPSAVSFAATGDGSLFGLEDFLDVSDDDDIEESDSEDGYEESASASVPVSSVPIAASVSASGPGPAFASFAAPVLASASEIPAKVTSSDAVGLSAVSVATTSDGSLFGLEDFLDVGWVDYNEKPAVRIALIQQQLELIQQRLELLQQRLEDIKREKQQLEALRAIYDINREQQARIGTLVGEPQALTDDEGDLVQSAPTPASKRKGKGNGPAAKRGKKT